jgi:hypothetical protein
VDKVERPARVGSGLDQDGRACSQQLYAGRGACGPSALPPGRAGRCDLMPEVSPSRRSRMNSRR